MATNKAEPAVDFALGLAAAAVVGVSAARLSTSLSLEGFRFFALFVCGPIAFSGVVGGLYAARVVYRGRPDAWQSGWWSGILQVMCLVLLSLLIGFTAFPIVVAVVLLSLKAGWLALIAGIGLFGIPVAVAAVGWSALFVLHRQRQRARLAKA